MNFNQVSFENSFTNTNLFTTSESPNIRILILKSLFLFIEGGQENIFHWSKKYFRPLKNVFLSPFNKQKQRFGELEFEYLETLMS